MKPYFFSEGIKELSATLTGKENIYLGIRPYGFHAGNELPFLVYPWLLCNSMIKLGKIPKFTFHLFINDWEQCQLSGPDPKEFPFNVYPLDTTFQFTHSMEDPSVNIVDYWQPIIEKNVREMLVEFKSVKVKAIRNSHMKNFKEMKSILIKTIANPKLVSDVLAKYSTGRVLDWSLLYGIAICPKCKTAQGLTEVIKEDQIRHFCKKCFEIQNGKYEDFEYWFYHKPLALPRIMKYKIDLCITGADHYKEGDFVVRQKLFEAFGENVKVPQTLYTESVYGKDGEMMGKSKGNHFFIDPKELIKIVENNSTGKIYLK